MSLVFKRLQSNLNIFPLIREVAENFNDFHTALGRQKTIPVQKETMTIYLVKGIRIPGEGNYHSRLSNSQQIVKTKLYDKYTECKYFLNWFQKTYGGQVYRVMLVHLQVNGKVYPHTDYGEYYKDKDRFHLGLTGYYDFTVGDETQRFGAGDLFWFDNKTEHSSKNATPLPRISLIFDAKGCRL